MWSPGWLGLGGQRLGPAVPWSQGTVGALGPAPCISKSLSQSGACRHPLGGAHLKLLPAAGSQRSAHSAPGHRGLSCSCWSPAASSLVPGCVGEVAKSGWCCWGLPPAPVYRLSKVPTQESSSDAAEVQGFELLNQVKSQFLGSLSFKGKQLLRVTGDAEHLLCPRALHTLPHNLHITLKVGLSLLSVCSRENRGTERSRAGQSCVWHEQGLVTGELATLPSSVLLSSILL